MSEVSNTQKSLLVGPYAREDQVHFDETDLIAAYVGRQKNGLMIDVGAHFGFSSAPFMAKGWNVLGFEPDPNNRAKLRERQGDNPLLTIIEDAVSDVAGEIVSFYASDESTGVSGLSGFTEKHKKICEVKTTTLRDQIAQNNLGPIDFLKIDTEGFDLMVLKGFPWETHRPKIIECEYENSKTMPLGYLFEDIAEYLLSYGYHVYVSEWHPIVRYGIRHDWKMFSKYPCALSTDKAWGNLLAFESKPDEKKLTKYLLLQASLTQENEDAKIKIAAPTIVNKFNLRISKALSPFPRLRALAERVSRSVRT